MSRVGIRRKVKGVLKRALGADREAPPPAPPSRNAPRPASSAPDGLLFARTEPSEDVADKGRMWVQVKGLVPEEFLVGSVRPVEIFGRRYALARTGDGFHAVLDRCPHAGGSLGEGRLVRDRVACSMHELEFDVRDGSCESDPDLVATVVEVKVQDDMIFVETDR